MALWQGRSKQKETGGKYWPSRKKRGSEMGANPVYTRLGDGIKQRVKTLARSYRKKNKKTGLSQSNIVNLSVKPGEIKKVKIDKVLENKANRHFVRMNVLNKGAIIQTSEGLARITSKPTQDGVVNAVLIKK